MLTWYLTGEHVVFLQIQNVKYVVSASIAKLEDLMLSVDSTPNQTPQKQVINRFQRVVPRI